MNGLTTQRLKSLRRALIFWVLIRMTFCRFLEIRLPHCSNQPNPCFQVLTLPKPREVETERRTDLLRE